MGKNFMRVSLVAVIVFVFSTCCYAEDAMAPVFERIDDIVTRVESGISLNSYAESLAQLKIDYKKASENKDNPDNPLLSERMKNVIMYLDDYAKAWRWMEIDKKRYIFRPPSYITAGSCAVNTPRGIVYEIPCVKNEILNVLKEAIGTAKSAHYNGW